MTDAKKILYIIIAFLVWSTLCTGTGFFISARQQSSKYRAEITELEQRLRDSESTVTRLEEAAIRDGYTIENLRQSNNRLKQQLDGAQSTIDEVISGLEGSGKELEGIIQSIRDVRKAIKEYQDNTSGDNTNSDI
jgi:chromosome segregation ATPase